MLREHNHEIREQAIENLPNLTGDKISIRKHNHALQILFEHGIHIQNPNELIGSWYVFMLTGIIPSFRVWKHHKVFYREETEKVLRGYNVFIFPLFKKFIWGRNRIIKGTEHNVINYNTDENSLMFRGIRDQIKFIPELGIFLGRFCIERKPVNEGPPSFIGYFTLAPTFIFDDKSRLAELCRQHAKDGFITLRHLNERY